MKILIATPVFGRSVDVGYLCSLLQVIGALIKEGIGFDFCFETRNLINQARNRSVHYALNNGFDKIVFIDADIQFRASDVMNLIKSEHRVVGGVYPLKGFPIKLNFLPLQVEGQPDLYDPNEFIKNAPDDGCVSVRMIPGGFMCIDMSVFRDLEPHVQKYLHRDPLLVNAETETMFFPFTIGPDGHLFMEDWSFCELVRTKLNENIYWNTKVIVEHVGHHVFSATREVDKTLNRINIHEKQQLVENPFSNWPRNLPCFCGSGEKFKKCHDQQLQDAKVVATDGDVLKKEYARILTYVKSRVAKGLDYKLKAPVL